MFRFVLFCALPIVSCAGFLLDTFFGSSSNVSHLHHYNVDKSQISVSGVSSGAAFATQIHVIYSSHIMGVGMIAGIPYACTGGFSVATALTSCMKMPSLVSTTYLETLTNSADVLGTIDNTAHLSNDRIWIFDGINDTKVNPGIGAKIKDFYAHYNHDPTTNIKTVFNIPAEHGVPTNNYGAACDKFSPSTAYLNNCNFSAAYHLLNHIYGGQLLEPKPNAVAKGQDGFSEVKKQLLFNGTAFCRTLNDNLAFLLLEFKQSDVFHLSTPHMFSMDNTGYIFVPRGCADKSKACKLHVAFHGCKMGRDTVGDKFVRHAGYNEVGGLNDIIILYPQVDSRLMSANPEGCWDWWGYTGLTFATKNGFQPTAIKRMIDIITG